MEKPTNGKLPKKLSSISTLEIKRNAITNNSKEVLTNSVAISKKTK